tara:strand:- start:5934 stop:6434 length:501 start_codon:yes stop_codon:yes gene_type:complete
MKIFSLLFVALFASFTLTSCTPRHGGYTKEDTGKVLGGIAGGVLGSRVGKGRGRMIATIGGAIVGAMIGGEIGKQLDERDRLLLGKTTQSALEYGKSGSTNSWKNPDSGNSGIIVPKRAYKPRITRLRKRYKYCREFQQTIIVGGMKENAYGKACRQPDGQWKIVR